MQRRLPVNYMWVTGQVIEKQKFVVRGQVLGRGVAGLRSSDSAKLGCPARPRKKAEAPLLTAAHAGRQPVARAQAGSLEAALYSTSLRSVFSGIGASKTLNC